MNVILRGVVAAGMLLLPMALVAQIPAPPRLNIDYFVLATPQPVYEPVKGKIEVAEVFSYACPHCSDAAPNISAWEKAKAPDVNLVFVHATGSTNWERFARGFYAAEAKKIRERSHEAIFRSIFVEQSVPADASLEAIAKFYSKYGVTATQMLAIMNSPSINAKLNRSKQFTIRTGANTTPTIIIAGKYRVSPTREGGFPGMLKTVDFLVAKERAAIAARALVKPAAKPVPAILPAKK
ncbi:MAG: thiol:disulfide interchange protein DsbA/DsbL [Arenimonas sp.]